MRTLRTYFYFCITGIIHCSCFSQNSQVDSLIHSLPNVKEDTSRLEVLNDISKLFSQAGQYEESRQYAENAIELCNKLSLNVPENKLLPVIRKNKGNALNTLGIADEVKGDYASALKNYNSALAIRKTLPDRKSIAGTYNNIGNIYFFSGNYPEALKYYFSALKIREEINDKKGIAKSYGNIGGVCYSQGNYADALSNYKAALKIRKEINDQQGIALSLAGIGAVNFELKNYDEALKNHLEAISISEAVGDKHTVADEYNNAGVIYDQQAKYDDALKAYESSLKMRVEMEDHIGIAACYANIAQICFKQHRFKEARENAGKSLFLSLKNGYKDVSRAVYYQESKLDSADGNYKGSIENYKKFILYRDSLNNEENTKKTVQSQMQYEFDKKEQETKSAQDKKDAVTAEEKQKQRMIIYAISSGLFLVGLLAFFIFRSYRQKQKVNIEISKQKELIEEKQKEILDSIHYAKRIQIALLPTEKYISKNLKGIKE